MKQNRQASFWLALGFVCSCFSTLASYTTITSDAAALGGATGGDEVRQIDNGDGTLDLIHIFNSSGSLTIPTKNKIAAGSWRLLMVGGGGGGGGDCGGGGGAGGLVYKDDVALTPGIATITVGGGGAAGAGQGGKGVTGGNTIVAFGTTTFTALGGGGGGCWANPGVAGLPGGSGGGAGGEADGGTADQPTSPTGGFGNAGGRGFSTNRGGGGGGAGTAGGTATATQSGNGGDGKQYNISGEDAYYAGGGGAGWLKHNASSTTAQQGAGGSGVGGDGQGETGDAQPGTPNTGSGGGGAAGGRSACAAAAGGSGVVIVRYTVPKPKESTVKPLVDAGLITFTGAEMSYVDGDLVLQYKGATGNLVLPSYAKAWILSVGGGGAGGSAKENSTTYGSGGGGGGGQVNEQKDQLLTGGTYAITVGAGGAPSAVESGLPGGNGQISKIVLDGEELAAYTAVGGGGGGVAGPGNEGASGGGGSFSSGSQNGGVATAGFAGGAGAHNKAGGGGGGAGEAGSPTSANGKAGKGGDGAPSFIAVDEGDDPIFYAAGGGGGTITTSNVGLGGTGGGGTGGGGLSGTAKAVTPGDPNTGSGGGGGSHKQAGGAGGSGIVIIRISEALAGDPIKPATTNWVYTGEEQVLVPESLAYTVEGDGAGTDAGSYHVTVTLKPGFQWNDGTTDVVEFVWTIAPKPVGKPTAPENLVFNKGDQLALPTPDAALVFAEGSVTNATNAGTYTYTVTLKDDNYVWAEAEEGHERDPETVTWKIAAQPVSVPPVLTGLVYTGGNQDAVDTTLIDEDACEFVDEDPYTYSQRDAGKYTFRLTLKNTETVKNYVWSVDDLETYEDQERTWSIAQAANAVSDLAITGWMKGNTPNTPTATATFGASTIVYSYATQEDAAEADWSTTVPTEPGTWWVRATVAETTNWASAEAKMAFEIYGDPSEIYEYSTEFTLGTFTGTVPDIQVPIVVSEELVHGFYYNQVDGPTLMAFTQDGIVLPYEVSGWNPGGETVFWVRAAELKSGAAIKMWWRVKSGKAPLPNDTGAVWRDYVGVWHMDETITADTAATTKSMDASGNQLHATPTKGTASTANLNQMVSLAGVIGNARVNSSVTAVQRGNRLLTARPLSDVGSTFVFSGWFRMNASGGSPRLVGNKVGNTGNGWSIEMAGNTTGIINRFSGADGNRYTIQKVCNLLNTWSHLTFVYDEETASVYCNGQLKWTKPAGAIRVVDNPTGALAFGANSDGSEYSLNGAYDELRYYKGTTTAERIRAEYEIAQQTSATTVGPVYHGVQIVDSWLVKPSITPLSWEKTDDPASIVTVSDGTLASGRAVQHTFFYVNEPTNRFTDVSSLTKPGLVRVVFAPADDPNYEPLSESLEVRIFDRQDYADLGGSASGRVLLMNNDAGEGTARPAVDYQGWYDRVNRSESLLTQANFWECFGDPNDFVDSTYNIKGGTNWVLWTTNRQRRLWTLENCRHGNTYAKGDTTAAGKESTKMLATQNYLPWSKTSRYITAHNIFTAQAQHVGQLLMRNVVGAAVYSPIYTNGVGTIYFDAVNGWTGQATEDETNPYQIVVEVATETADGTPFSEENCAAERDDGTIDPFGNIDPTAWTPVRQYPVRVSATGEMATPEGVLTNRLAVTTGKSMTEFYRVYVPVNLEACCFRIRRVTRYDLAGNDGRLILLDNILVSYPPMSAELQPTGLDTTTDPEKKGAFTFGQELATTVPFPSAGETNVFGRAAPIYHVNGAVADVDPASFIQAAKMHYRWRYLNQRETPWATLDLDVMNGFRTVTPLEIPDAVGDMEFWFDSLLQAPFFRYVDYSGSGKGLPATVYTEEIATAENRLNAREPLASGGRDWFFRLRNGTSAWEGFAIELAGGTALDGRYPMELLDDETWRALVRIPTNATGLCSFTFVGSNETTPGATELPGSRLRFYPGAVSVTNSIPANGTLAASGAAQSFEIDHNANYLEVKVSTKFNTWSVSRAEYQNFNNWHDAYTPAAANPAFKASYPTNGVDDVTMTTRVTDASGWKLFSNADPEWNEPFYSVESDSPAFPKDEVLSAHATPNVWNAYNFSFVSCNFTTKADHNKPTTGGGSGIAAKLLGQGQGSLEFTKANAPNGVDTVTVQARLGQSMTFDAVSYDSLSLKKKNYTFVVPAIMSEKTPENGNSDGDMTVGASVSLFGYYRPSRGAYEFRVERRYKANTVNLSLYKWSYVGGAMTPTLLCEQDFGSLVMWWDKGQSNAQFQPMFIRFEEATDGTKIIAGLGAFRAAPNGTGSDMNTAFTNTKGYGGLVFTDRSSDRLTAGSYGVAAKDCPAQFVLPFHYDEGAWDGLTINENGNTQKGSGRYFNPSGNALTLPAGFSPDRYSIKEDWEIIPGRCEYYTYKGQSNWAGLRIPETLSQTLDLYLQLKGDKSGTWRKIGSVPIKGSAFATYTFPVHMAGQWNLRLKTGSSNVDVAIKSVTQTQWQAPDHEDWSWQDDDFVYSQGLVQTNTTLKLNTVTLQPSRGTWTRPLSVRSPLLNGLGKVSFSYTGVEEHAEIWVQMATNNVGNTLTGYNGYNESLASVDLGVQEPAATWVTIAKYTAADLAKASSQTVYLGYHNQPDDPIEGAFRLFIPTNVVYAAGVIATNDTIEAADKNLKYGQITITGMTVTDEPGLSDRSWFGFNLRGIGDGSDEEKRMYLTDMTLVGESGSGLDLALNNSLAGIAEGDRERARATYPSIVSPTFKSSGEQKNGVGTVAFKARLYSTNGLPETEQGGIVEIFGSQNSATGKWEPITNFVVKSSVFQDFKWESRGKIYAAVKFQVTSAAVKDSSAAPDRDRVILDEIVVGERIQPALSFLYARPFRNNLMTPVVIDDILSINEQPLVGESWGVQTQLSLKQLTDEIDLDRGFEVSFVYHTGEEPWGYEQWGKELKSIPLVQVGAKDDLIFRSVGESPESLYEPQTTSSTIVQYQVLVKYFDRQGTMYTSQLESKADWQQPDWYHPVDFNAKHGGYDSVEKFSAYTILDTVSPGRAWINEVNFNDGTADQNGGDVPTGNQFMEICVPSGVDMSGWFVRLTDLNTNYCVLARFGDGEALPKSKATVHEVEGFEFVLMESPETNMAGGIRDAEGNPVVADGIWSRDGIGGTADLGTLSFARPFQFELVRPSGIVEHQFVLGGTNTFANKSYGYMYDATNLVAKLEANGHSPIRFLAGDELARLSDNARLASAGVMGGTADGNPAPGAKETWQSNLVFTPGRLNRDENGVDQVIPAGWYVAPNGTNVWVTLKVEGDNLVQNLGGETNSVVKFVVPQGATTNVTYTAKPWYELAELDANGETVAEHVARFGHPYVFEFSPTGRTYTVVAKSGFDSGLDGYIDLAGPYAPSIVSWLNERWPGRTADEIKLGKVKELGASSAENPLELLDMYWLDIPPFAATPEEESADTIWWLRYGISNPMYGKVVRTRQYGSASDPVAVAFTNIQLEAKMYISNDVTKVAYAPYRLQGLDNAKSDESAGRWTSESFQVKGVLNNGQPLNEGYLPFRSFKFAPGSFTDATDANPFTSRIEIIDPFSTESPGFGYGWSNWPNTTGFFFKLALTTNSVPHTIETLKADSTYDSGF